MVPEKYKEYVASNIEFPKECTVCHGELNVLDNGMVCCVNPSCPQKIVHKLANFFDVLAIDGAGESCVSALVNEVGMKRIPELISDAISGGNGLSAAMKSQVNGAKLRKNMLAAMNEPISMSKFLSLFDFDGFSEAKLSGLERLEVFGGWYDNPLGTLATLRSYTPEKLSMLAIPGFSAYEVKLNMFTQVFNFLDEITGTLELGKFSFKKPVEMDALGGMSFCFTGAMEYNRDDLERTVKAFGGQVKGSVSAKLDFLVQADENSTSTKSKKAKQLGVTIITPEKFFALLKENGVNTIL
jgi:DNA ligase (NAD+)